MSCKTDRQTDIRAVGRYCNVDTTNKRINMGIYYCLFIHCTVYSTVTEYDVRWQRWGEYITLDTVEGFTAEL